MLTTICYNLPPTYHSALRNIKRVDRTTQGELLDACARMCLAKMDEDEKWMLTNKRSDTLYAFESEPAPRDWPQTSSRVSSVTRDCIREFSDRSLVPERFVPRVLLDLFAAERIAEHSGPPAPHVPRRQTSVYIADTLLDVLARLAAERKMGVGAVLEMECAHLLSDKPAAKG